MTMCRTGNRGARDRGSRSVDEQRHILRWARSDNVRCLLDVDVPDDERARLTLRLLANNVCVWRHGMRGARPRTFFIQAVVPCRLRDASRSTNIWG